MSNGGEKVRSGAHLVQPQDWMDGRESLERIRDLLFGTHMRTLENRLGRLEDRLLREIGDVRDGLRKQIDSLEAFVKSELKTLNARVTAEQEARSDMTKELKTGIRETSETLDRKAAQLDKKIEEYAKDIREQILEQTRRLTDDIRHQHEDALRVTQESSDQIRAEYVGRSKLSQLLTELAVRLDAGLVSDILAAPEEAENE